MMIAAANMTTSQITVFILSIAVLLGLARFLGEWARRLHQPAVLGEILAGILLGKTILGQMSPELLLWLFPETGPSRIALEGFTTLAVVLLLLVAGLEVDLSTVMRQGKAAILISLTGIVFPFAIGFTVAWFLPVFLGKNPTGELLPFALFVGIAMAITALPVIAKILMDLNMFKSDVGMLIMSAAMVDDLLGWLGFAMVMAMITPGGSGNGVGQTLLLTLVFVVLMLTIGRKIFHRMLPFIQAHSSWPGGVLGFILVMALLCAAFTESIGIHAIFGGFIAGVAIGDSTHLRGRTRDTIHQFVTNIFAPVFFASVGLHLSFIEAFELSTVVVVLVIAIIAKVGGCYIGGAWAGLNPRESLAIGFGMSARGAMEIVLAQLARQANLITDELFVAIVIMAIVTSLISGPAIERILARKVRRRLGDLLTEKHYLPEMRAVDRQQAIGELSEVAARLTDLPTALIYDAVWRRERMMSTGLGNGLAVPHARLTEIKKPLIVIGRSVNGIDFDASDAEEARIICLLLTPENDPTAQLEMLDGVARAFINPKARAGALHAKSYIEFLAVLKQYESDDEHAM